MHKDYTINLDILIVVVKRGEERRMRERVIRISFKGLLLLIIRKYI
jgi:hypothetical protein